MNKAGEWIVYYHIPSGDFRIGIKKYPNRRKAIKAAYYYLATYIEQRCYNDNDHTYWLTPLHFLEGDRDLAVYVIRNSMDGENTVDATAYILMVLEDDE